MKFNNIAKLIISLFNKAKIEIRNRRFAHYLVPVLRILNNSKLLLYYYYHLYIKKFTSQSDSTSKFLYKLHYIKTYSLTLSSWAHHRHHHHHPFIIIIIIISIIIIIISIIIIIIVIIIILYIFHLPQKKHGVWKTGGFWNNDLIFVPLGVEGGYEHILYKHLLFLVKWIIICMVSVF